MLINLAENVGRQNGKFVRTLGIIESPDNSFQDRIVDLKTGRKLIRCLGAGPFLLKMKETRVVALVGLSKKITESGISAVSVKQSHQTSIDFDTSIFADA